MKFRSGDRVAFRSRAGTVMQGSVVSQEGIMGPQVRIHIDRDPFPVVVKSDQLTKVGTRTMSEATTDRRPLKELRRAARAAGIDGWEELTREELESALEGVEDSSGAEAPESEEGEMPAATATRTRKSATKRTAAKTTAKKAPAKATAARKSVRAAATNGTADNPFRQGTNLWHITEALKKGGKRSDLIKKLLPHLNYNPRAKSAANFDEEVETDRRLKVVGYLLKNTHGWDYTHTGRGPDSYIKAVPPA